MGLIIGAGIFLGAYVGARIGLSLSPTLLRRSFGAFVICIGLRMLLL